MEDQHLLTKEELIANFGWDEYLVLFLMLLISALIGVYFAWRGQKDNAEYLLGGKSMGTLPVSMSLIATMMSAIGMLGTPSEMYRYGSQFGGILFSFPLMMYSVIYWYFPVFYKLEVSTSYEYLEWRFNRGVRMFCSILFSIQMMLYMAIVVYAPALAIAQVTGLGVDLACGVIMVVCIVYTTIGGMKAVMWTDAFQTFMMFTSLIVVIIKGTIDTGGVENVIMANYNSSRIEFFNLDPDITVTYTFWSVVIGGWFSWLSIYGTNQAMVQRYISAKNESTAICAMWWNCFGITFLHVLYIFAAWVAYAFYNLILECDPMKTKLIEKQDQIIPLFVSQIMINVPSFTGLFMAGILSGSLSTVSSGLSSLAAIVFQDFLQAGCQLKISAEKSTLVTQALSAGIGILCYALIYIIKYVPAVAQAAIALFGITGGPILGIFALGMFFPWANAMGTFTGGIIGVIFTTWIYLGKTIAINLGTYSTDGYSKDSVIAMCPPDLLKNSTIVPQDSHSFTHLPLYEISHMWYSPISCIMCFLIGIFVSIISKPQNIKILNPDLISPAFYRAFRYFPWLSYIVGQQKNFTDAIGSEYIPGDKERQLRKQGIMNNAISLDDLKN